MQKQFTVLPRETSGYDIVVLKTDDGKTTRQTLANVRNRIFAINLARSLNGLQPLGVKS